MGMGPVRIGALALGCLAAAQTGVSARPLAAIRESGTLRVGLTGDYAPYAIRRGEGAMTGADVTMAHDLARSLGVALEIVPTTWKSLRDDLLADRYDIAMGGVSVTPDRAAVADFSLPVTQDGKRPIVRCADAQRFVSLDAINRPEVRVVVNPGGTNERFATAHVRGAAVRVHPDNRTIFEEVAEGRADLMITDGAEVDYQSRRHKGVLCPAAVPGPFDRADKAYWMTRDPALKAAVDGWLQSVLTSGAYARALAAAAE